MKRRTNIIRKLEATWHESLLHGWVPTRLPLLVATLSLAVGAATTPGRVEAAQLELATTTPSPVVVGQRFEVAISGVDFPDGADGGDLSLVWSENLAFVGLTVEAQPWETSASDVSTTPDHALGSLDVFSADDTPGLGGVRFPIARVVLEAQAEGPAQIGLGTDRVGWSLDGASVDYGFSEPLQLAVVPEPATAAMLAAGVGLLAMRARASRRIGG